MTPGPWTCPPDRRPHLRAVVTIETARAAMAGRPIPRACRHIDSVLNHLDALDRSVAPPAKVGVGSSTNPQSPIPNPCAGGALP